MLCSRVSRTWQAMLSKELLEETKPVWLYVIFRKNRVSGHSKPSVNISFDGPVFWEKRVVYVYCCSCHFAEKHAEPLTGLCGSLAKRIQRICLVDSPADYPFITDGFFNFINDNLPNLQFLYLRELDLENLNFPTVKKLAQHPSLKKLIAHMCRKIDVLLEFGSLPQLLVVKGEIQGLKAFLGADFPQGDDSLDDEDSQSIPVDSSVSTPSSGLFGSQQPHSSSDQPPPLQQSST